MSSSEAVGGPTGFRRMGRLATDFRTFPSFDSMPPKMPSPQARRQDSRFDSVADASSSERAMAQWFGASPGSLLTNHPEKLHDQQIS